MISDDSLDRRYRFDVEEEDLFPQEMMSGIKGVMITLISITKYCGRKTYDESEFDDASSFHLSMDSSQSSDFYL